MKVAGLFARSRRQRDGRRSGQLCDVGMVVARVDAEPWLDGLVPQIVAFEHAQDRLFQDLGRFSFHHLVGVPALQTARVARVPAILLGFPLVSGEMDLEGVEGVWNGLGE